MNFAECVGLFCCPPWLPSIINKLSFKPPENPSYVMSLKSDGRVTFSFTGSENMLEPIPPYIIIRSYLVDCRKDKIAMVHIRTPAEPGYTILYSHGNACDLGHTFGLLITMCQILRCDVVVYDYNGYGSSTGKPNENGMRHNIECVYSYMISNLKIKPENVIVFGQSIGSVAALHLAANQMVAGVILQSALASGFRLVFPGFSRTWCCDPFQNAEVIKKVECPVLIIHGLEDEVIPFSHGFTLFDNAKYRVEPLWLSFAGHDNVEQCSEYFPTLGRFIFSDLQKRKI